MRHIIMNAIIPAAAIAAILSVNSCNSSPSKKAVTNIPATHIQRIEATDAVSVVYIPTEDETSVTVTCDSSYLHNIDVRTEGTTLYAGILKGKGVPTKGINVKVKAPAVTYYKASNAAQITNKETCKIDGGITIDTETAGQVKLSNVKCATLHVTSSTASNVTVTQLDCQALKAKLSTAASALFSGKCYSMAIDSGTTASYCIKDLKYEQKQVHQTQEPYSTPEERARQKAAAKQKAADKQKAQ